MDARIHKLTTQTCPHCGKFPMIEVKKTGFRFCSDPDYLYGCDFEIEVEKKPPLDEGGERLQGGKAGSD